MHDDSLGCASAGTALSWIRRLAASGSESRPPVSLVAPFGFCLARCKAAGWSFGSEGRLHSEATLQDITLEGAQSLKALPPVALFRADSLRGSDLLQAYSMKAVSPTELQFSCDFGTEERAPSLSQSNNKQGDDLRHNEAPH